MASKVHIIQKKEMRKKGICTHGSNSSISTDEPLMLDFNNPKLELPENISFVSEEFRPVGCNRVKHMLIENSGENKQVACYFCLVTTGKRIRVGQGCTGCKKAFHTNCWTAFHCADAMGDHMRALSSVVHAAIKKPAGGNKLASKYVCNFDEFNLKCFEIHEKKKK